MMRYVLVVPALIALSCASESTDTIGQYDVRAVAELDSLSQAIGGLTSVSFTLNTVLPDREMEHDVYMRGPDKIYFYSRGLNVEVRRGFWFDGSVASFYSYNNNNYTSLEAPGSILQVIDFLSAEYALDFPAGDFFYPTLTDDILAHYENVWYLGDELQDGVETVHIRASNETEDLDIWIDSAAHIPYKMTLATSGASETHYEAVFSNWKMDPFLPDLMFEFEPPANSVPVDFAEMNPKTTS